ncbi:hypothetical protein RPALISO_139 [Ruegeria phage RpAliso]|nr:hypothetical protein RPALISO_139 [Ruegeria phage RpAliso]
MTSYFYALVALSAAYNLFIGAAMRTPNLRSSLILKVIPMTLGLLILAALSISLGFLTPSALMVPQ